MHVLEQPGEGVETSLLDISDHVELARATLLRTTAIGTGAVDFQPVRFSQEATFRGDAVDDGGNLLVVEFDQRPAVAADHVIVLRISVIVFVDLATIRASDLPQQAAFFHQSQRSIDARSADAAAVVSRTEALDQVIRFEVLVRRIDFLDDDFPFTRQSQPLSDQEFPELLNR